MTELMEQGSNLIPCDERWLTLRCLGVVAYIIYNRQLAALLALLGKGAHPCTATLGRTAEVIAVEKGDWLAVLIAYLEYLHVWVIGRDVLALLEVQSVNTMSGIEHTIYLYAVDVEVWLNLIIGNVEHLLLHLRRIIEAVVWLQFEVLALSLLGILFYRLGLSISLWSIFLDELLQEIIHILAVLSHRLFERIVGIAGISHQFALLGTQLGNLGYDREGVEIRVGSIGTVDTCHIHLLAQFAVLEIGKDRLLGGVDDDDAVRCLASAALCIFLALCNVSIAQSGELFLAVHPNYGVVGSGRKKIAPLLLQFRDAGVDLLHALHLLGRKEGA